MAHPILSNPSLVTRSELEGVARGSAAMQRQLLNAIVGCVALVQELRTQLDQVVAELPESRVEPQLHALLQQLHMLANGAQVRQQSVAKPAL